MERLMSKPRAQPKMSFIVVGLMGLLISISAFSARADAKPLNQNQVKFRRLPPKEFSALVGSSITIECEAGGSPPPSIHWLKDGKRIVQNFLNDKYDNTILGDDQQANLPPDDIRRVGLSSTRSRLFIDCANLHDEATYTCVAENAFSRISSHTKLNLIKPVQVDLNLTGSENDLLGSPLDEAVAAAALKELAAKRQHESANTNDHRHHHHHKQSFSQESNSGDSDQQQQQQQQQKNSNGLLSAVAQCSNQQNSRIPEPLRIHMWTHNIIEIMQNNVILFCRSNAQRKIPINGFDTITNLLQQDQQSQLDVSSTNANRNDDLIKLTTSDVQKDQNSADDEKLFDKYPLVRWSLPNNKPVGPEMRHKYEVLESGDLLIKDLDWNDMGSYVCTVSDEQSSDSVSSFVYPTVTSPAKQVSSRTNKRAILTSQIADYR